MLRNTILIVDDEQQVLQLLEIELSTEGYEVCQAHNGKEAIEKAKEFKPDLILMDIMLPDMTGPDIVRSLKGIPSVKETPVLFLTALLTKGEEREDQMIHIDEHSYHSIAKPFEPKELLAKIKALMGKEQKF